MSLTQFNLKANLYITHKVQKIRSSIAKPGSQDMSYKPCRKSILPDPSIYNNNNIILSIVCPIFHANAAF